MGAGISLDRAALLGEARGDLGLQLRVWCERGLLAIIGRRRPEQLARAEALAQAIGTSPTTYASSVRGAARGG